MFTSSQAVKYYAMSVISWKKCKTDTVTTDHQQEIIVANANDINWESKYFVMKPKIVLITHK